MHEYINLPSHSEPNSLRPVVREIPASGIQKPACSFYGANTVCDARLLGDFFSFDLACGGNLDSNIATLDGSKEPKGAYSTSPIGRYHFKNRGDPST